MYQGSYRKDAKLALPMQPILLVGQTRDLKKTGFEKAIMTRIIPRRAIYKTKPVRRDYSNLWGETV